MTPASADQGCIRNVKGLLAGHHTLPQRPTGCSVVIAPEGATAAVDMRGAAPGTRETDLLRPGNLVEKIHAIVLSGGSAWGLAAATGVMQWLQEHDIGLDTGYGKVPLVPAAVLFDLPVGDAAIRPAANDGYLACEQAFSQQASPQTASPLACGNVGAGAGATVGKLFGADCAMKGGIGSASITLHGITVGALVACNAVGDITHPETGALLAGARRAPGSLHLRHSTQSLLRGEPPAFGLPGTNTTIGIIATDTRLNRLQLQRLAIAGHDGLAQCIRPVHTMLDGDTLFALATGATADAAPMPDLFTLCAMATHAICQAIVCAIATAQGIRLGKGWWPAQRDLLKRGAISEPFFG